MKKALITGITGQDGSYLAELLLRENYHVVGLVRRSSTFSTERIDHLLDDIELVYGDMSDGAGLARTLRLTRPDEIYNLASQSHVRVSFDLAEYTGSVTGLGVTRLLEALRDSGIDAKFYQASSSEIFGNVDGEISEETPVNPRSPYGAAKAYAHFMTQNYREAYGLFAVNGILFNHESPRRGETFVSRKITRAVASILLGDRKQVSLGNIHAERDWGFAGDYVRAMWLMLQQDEPRDYVIATGDAHSVREFAEVAFRMAGLNWDDYVTIDPKYFRPTEIDRLIGNASKARAELKWRPEVGFSELVGMMMQAEIKVGITT